MFSRIWTKPSTKSCSEPMERLKAALQDCDAVVIGAGAGLSTAAGFTYTGERFEKYFSDFAAKYGIQDMYSGGFFPFATPEEHWAGAGAEARSGIQRGGEIQDRAVHRRAPRSGESLPAGAGGEDDRSDALYPRCGAARSGRLHGRRGDGKTCRRRVEARAGANLKIKVDKGVDFLITQLFYNNETFFRFLDEARNAGITVPILPGLMPITSAGQVKNIIGMSGTKIPKELADAIEKYKDNPADLKKAGLDYSKRQMENLLAHGVDGIHLYSMNKVEIARAIYE